MLFVKGGVTPPILLIAAALANMSEELDQTLTITSGTDGKHKKGSKHYSSEALDVRTKGLSDELIDELIAGLRSRLPSHDFVLESRGKPNEHLHIERDVK